MNSVLIEHRDTGALWAHSEHLTDARKRRLRRELLDGEERVDRRMTSRDGRGRPGGRGAGAAASWPRAGHRGGAMSPSGASPAPARCWTRCARRGVRVLLPVLLPDNDLDWGVSTRAPSGLVRRRPGLLEPDGRAARARRPCTGADAVLLPGLAVDARGMRLGRGGGSYDRVLARLERAGADPALVVLLYDARGAGRRSRRSRTTGRCTRR